MSAASPALSMRTIFVKITAILALSVGAVAATLSLLNTGALETVATDQTGDRAISESRLLADQVGGPLKFQKTGPVEHLFEEALEVSDGAIDGLVALFSDGSVATRVGAEIAPELRLLTERVIATGEVATSEDRFLVAMPVRYGASNELVGVVASDWSMDPALAIARDGMIRSALAACGVFMAAIIAALIASNWLLVRPLNRIRDVIRAMEDRDYGSEVPSTERGDEIGDIARALDGLRTHLAEAQEQERDAAFKSAAFMGSSAALMLLDADLVVRHVNPRLRTLMKRFEPLFGDRADSDRMIGQSIDFFHDDGQDIRRKLDSRSDGRFETILRFGDARISLTVRPVTGSDGARLGYVLEWSDITQDWLNGAVLDAIDSNLLKVDFDKSGQLLTANRRFLALLAQSEDQAKGTPFQSLVTRYDGTNDGTGSDLMATVTRDGVHVGQFTLNRGDEARILDGSITCIKDHEGKTVRFLLMGKDVTEAETRLRKAREAQEITEREQSRVVEELRVGLKGLSAGDLTTRLSDPFAGAYEELRNDFNITVERLSEALLEIIENAENIRNEANDISSTADGLSRRTETTAATLEETAAALDDMTSSVRTAADMATKADSAVAGAKSNAEASGEVVVETVSAMDQIAESSDRITSIIKVIDDIAFQTNLLALNAGVEAARAGDAGRGFAVVASEVRALAQRSSDAAREINDLIAQSGTQVKRGVELVGRTGDALREIVDSVSQIAVQVSEIAQSATQQSNGLAEINNAVTQLDQSTQQNAARLEETTAASESLTRDAVSLVQTVSHFNIARDGATPVVAFRSSQKASAEPPKDTARPEPRKTAAAGHTLANAEPGSWEDF